jgi:uncharacterized RDD family membrane protein YckC
VILPDPAIVVVAIYIDLTTLFCLAHNPTGHDLHWLIARWWPILAIRNRDRASLNPHFFD